MYNDKGLVHRVRRVPCRFSLSIPPSAPCSATWLSWPWCRPSGALWWGNYVFLRPRRHVRKSRPSRRLLSLWTTARKVIQLEVINSQVVTNKKIILPIIVVVLGLTSVLVYFLASQKVKQFSMTKEAKLTSLLKILCSAETAAHLERGVELNDSSKLPVPTSQTPVEFLESIEQLASAKYAFPDAAAEKKFYDRLEKQRANFENSFWNHAALLSYDKSEVLSWVKDLSADTSKLAELKPQDFTCAVLLPPNIRSALLQELSE